MVVIFVIVVLFSVIVVLFSVIVVFYYKYYTNRPQMYTFFWNCLLHSVKF